MSAALAAALALPTLAYAAPASDPTMGQGGNGTAGAASNYDKHRSGAVGTRHSMNNSTSTPASGGSSGSPGGGGCDPAATAASASAPVGQAAPGCK
jgi:hypothetical protein